MPIVVALALVLIVGAAFGLNALVNGGGSRAGDTGTVASVHTATTPFPQAINPGGGVQTLPQPTLPQPTVPQQTMPQPNSNTSPAPTVSHYAVVYWDGMQIETLTPGDVVIDTVKLNSHADQANLEPGDQLVSVDGHQLSSATNIQLAVNGLRSGQLIPVQVVYGSSSPQTLYLTLGAPPSLHP